MSERDFNAAPFTRLRQLQHLLTTRQIDPDFYWRPMIFRETALKGACLIELQPHVDERGQFARTWCREEFARHGLDVEFAQSNVSINPTQGTMRGLHWQVAPHGEAKLVRCVRGAIFRRHRRHRSGIAQLPATGSVSS